MADYTLSPATPEDAEAIASLFAQSWTSPFSQLQFGEIDPISLATAMAPRIKSKLENPTNSCTMVMHSPATKGGKVAAVAQWTLPLNVTHDSNETSEEKAELQHFEDEMYRNSLPEKSNKDLIMEFTKGLRELRAEIIQARPHYLLENIATHPDHRGQGLASKLLEWVFPFADEKHVLVYLDTADDNPAMRIYKKVGFEESGSSDIEKLERFGGEGIHRHVAFVRAEGR
ncbi:acyl-CoA N-acyltransferase [Massarina eburnea CBS 473.64]|uniref:Acyl-CoA N-acyltransferase n=1 Tax=Massarina eburnea CBS 473.64 TaxID=1395130 RepID=A0A6A6S5E0_9PLEO|nr:acyl-CoA N-acyltransferase [Massarina eburnea CBS 473.64]